MDLFGVPQQGQQGQQAPVVPDTSAQVVGGPSPDGWFREGSQEAQWDEGMNELLETLEGGVVSQHHTESMPSSSGTSLISTMESNEWAWEQALVDI